MADTDLALLCVGIQYSLFKPGKKWHLSKHEDEGVYKENLFSDERLDGRFEVFKSVTVPSLENIKKHFSGSLLVVIATSKDLPSHHKSKLYSLTDKLDFVVVVEQSPDEASINDAMKLKIKENLSGLKRVVGTVRLDDDDALSYPWCKHVEKKLTKESVGEVLTFPRGMTGYYDGDRKKFIGFIDAYQKNIALGLTSISFFDGVTLSHETIYAMGNHMKINAKEVLTEDRCYLRVVNQYRDRNYKKGFLSNRLKSDFLKGLKDFPRVFPELSSMFGISEVCFDECDSFVFEASRAHGGIVVEINDSSLSRAFQDFQAAFYFYSDGEIVKKEPYRSGSKHFFSSEEAYTSTEVKVFIRSAKGEKKSQKKK